MLDLAPEIETTVRDYAAREGVTVDELMARTFPRRQPQAVAAPAVLSLSREEIARRNAPLLAILEAQIAEAENATPEEVAQAEAEWLELRQNLDATRRANGERLLFPDVPPKP